MCRSRVNRRCGANRWTRRSGVSRHPIEQRISRTFRVMFVQRDKKNIDPSEKKNRKLHARHWDATLSRREKEATDKSVLAWQLCALADGTDASVHQFDGSQLFSPLVGAVKCLFFPTLNTNRLEVISFYQHGLSFPLGMEDFSSPLTVCFNIWPPDWGARHEGGKVIASDKGPLSFGVSSWFYLLSYCQWPQVLVWVFFFLQLFKVHCLLLLLSLL